MKGIIDQDAVNGGLRRIRRLAIVDFRPELAAKATG